MDYAKLAYLKAEDLERRLGAAVTQEPQKTLKASFAPNRQITAEYPLTEIRGSGSISMIIKCTASEAGGGRLRFLLDGKSIAETELTPDSKEYLLLAQAELSGYGILAADSPGAYISGVELIVMGSAAIGRSAARYSLCEAHGLIAAMSAENEVIRLILTDSESPVFGNGIFLSSGNAADIIGYRDGFAAIFCDSYGNIWLTYLSQAGETLAAVPIGTGAESVTLTPWGNGIAAAKTLDGKLYLHVLYGDGCPPEDGQILKYDGNISFAAFVKGGGAALLAFESGGSSFLKPAEEAGHCADTIGVTLICR